MFGVIFEVIRATFVSFNTRHQWCLEILALRHQVQMLQRGVKRPALNNADRLLWVGFKKIWLEWKNALVIVRPETVVGWQRTVFRAFWRWKSRPQGGRPSIDPKVIRLIRRMWKANPTWGSIRIQDELVLLGIQVRNAFPYQTAPRYLLRDRERIYGAEVVGCIHNMGIEQKPIAPRSPWQNPYVERLIGSIRRECLDHMIILHEAHLQKILKNYLEYYHRHRPHRSLEHDAPIACQLEKPEKGSIIELPCVGGLHHRYMRKAA